MRSAATVLLMALCAFAQDKADPTGKYSNADLGLAFSGVYGWESQFPAGSGAWTTLARYTDSDMRAAVLLQVRNNPYATTDDLRTALKEEFKVGGEPTEDKPAYKEIAFQEATMKKGLKLPAIELEGFTVRIEAEGKKREYYLLSRTYFGKNRLFRVHCTAKRSRKKRVKDLFDGAVAGVTVEAGAEKVVRGVPFRSRRGRYRLTVPEGFMMELPAKRSKTDARFIGHRGSVTVSIYGYADSGDLIDQRDIMTDYYGDDIEITAEETKALGADAYRAKIKRKGVLTLVVGAATGKMTYRIHVTVKEKDADLAKRVLEKFEKSFKAG